jgi:cytochrome c oxidase assembly protein subunit 11
VPLYKLFCQVTGYGGTTQRVDTVFRPMLDRKITIRFDANTPAACLGFQPVQREMTMRIGETAQIAYGPSTTSTPTAGRATFNVTPEMAGAYFNKVECFCFTDTTLKPGESLDMPVVFYVDPDIVDVPELKNTEDDHAFLHILPDRGAEKPLQFGAPGGKDDDTTQTDGKLGG